MPSVEKKQEYVKLQDELLLALSKEAGYHQAILDVIGFLKTAKICHDGRGSIAIKKRIEELDEEFDAEEKLHAEDS
mgnify:CR=1 FL=1|tara:strand:+ start:4213 stop:4440 length:228 start_codon:yes stop_codon:yes gene_type:complete